MQALCQLEVLDDHFAEQIDDFLADETDDQDQRDRARTLIKKAWQHREEIDTCIRDVAEHWDLDRMAAVDRNAIRIAAHELLHRSDIPPRVAINEAVEIGKAFGTADSPSFINGILDAILKKATSAEQQEPTSEEPKPKCETDASTEAAP